MDLHLPRLPQQQEVSPGMAHGWLILNRPAGQDNARVAPDTELAGYPAG